MKSADGLMLTAFNGEVIAVDGCYCGIFVTRTSSYVSTFTQTGLQFIQALANNIAARFPNHKLQEAGQY